MSSLIFHLIAHTHWDREWYLPRAAFHSRLVPMLDDLIERLQADAGFRSFLLDGQTVLLEDYLRARPEREADVKALVKTNRLQLGPWYVLPDELIPSSDSPDGINSSGSTYQGPSCSRFVLTNALTSASRSGRARR